jgi:hypothetical protein
MTTIEATGAFRGWVRVFHNNNAPLSFLYSYEKDQTVTEVDTYLEIDEQEDVALVRKIFDLFNIGHEPEFGIPDERAEHYRKAGNRPLSVGDVVGIGDRFYTFDRRSAVRLLMECPPIRQRSSYGTVPLYWARAGRSSRAPGPVAV